MTRSHDIDPRQADCWQRYIDPRSPTFADAKNSAIAAGYTASHAEDIKKLDWFRRQERKIRLKDKGETVLEEMLDMPVAILTHSKTGEAYVVTDATLVKIKQDTAKFAVERLGKEDWSTRSEHVGADGGPIVTQELKQNANDAIDSFIGKNTPNPAI